ncbi:hypothetical protein EV193_105225 [Herbihabitans rhizosphaerae]|uniref:Dolichyl-phosphate-mannose-protein mannosyltransferase n=1 Tax=Herbihabitans rhizosphaerae TaxID=1872711 RepID=A0A4Q7KMZ0_9PSEU|nr:hypothetical protein [Herbihabitans rhizosphaerae]RZS37667.1 hypothetical protein EV193_105225 [Herbihabitans rhizosphaerae]
MATVVSESVERDTRLGRAWYANPYVQAAGLFALVRVVGVAILWLLADQHNRKIIDLLTAWDGDWYLGLAEHGYADLPSNFLDAAGNHTEHTALAFFPAYPKLVDFVHTVTGIGLEPSGVIVSALAGIAAALGIYRIGARLDGRHRVGLLLVALWAGAPLAISLSMTYTEALFTALAAWALVGVLEQRWLLAGLCCAAAGLARPSASVLVAVVGIAALIAVINGRRRPWAIACMVLCPLGLIGWWSYVAGKTGNLLGWFEIQRIGWGFEFDGGQESWKFLGHVLASGSSLMETVNVLVMIGGIVLTVLAAIQRVPWPLVAYSAGIVIMVIGASGITFAKARFMIPGFTLLIPIALGLANRKLPTAVAATAGVVLLGCWLSAYALTGWKFAV